MFLAAVWSLLLPWFLFLIPGIGIVTANKDGLFETTARIILWSLVGCMLVMTLTTWLGWSLLIPSAVLLLGTTISAWWHSGRWLPHPQRMYIALILLVIIVPYALLSIPFLLLHDGLPSGDSEKAILWGAHILTNQQLPDYHVSPALLNRDPVDFYTPGLHVVTAFLLKFSSYPLTSVGFFSIALCLVAILIAICLGRLLEPEAHYLWWPLLIGWLVVSNIRFLRYLREPGYHLQNILGEVLLFGLLWLSLSLLKKWRWSDIVLSLGLLISLIIGHQFSAFIAAFALLPVAVLWIVLALKQTPHLRRRLVQQALPLAIILGLLGLGGFTLGLQHKIPQLFTTTPHLLYEIAPLLTYPTLMGIAWVMLGIIGLVWMIKQGWQQWPQSAVTLGFGLSALAILILSQGPRFGLDIPPVRALFYSAIPFSIGMAWLLRRWLTTSRTSLVTIAIVIMLIGSGSASLTTAYQFDHDLRTDSALTAGELYLTQRIQQEPGGAVLVDNYNQQSNSWLVLSGHPMFTRLASDVSQQMSEAKQSTLRYQLYLNQLEFEKIYSLGNSSIIAPLLAKHNIKFLTGIDGSSLTTFAHNPLLVPIATGETTTLYERTNSPVTANPDFTPALQQWLLKNTTLANDIGDDEDTYEHLPASVAAPRLSSIQFNGHQTYRTTTAPQIALRFNINDYVAKLWQQTGDTPGNGQLQLFLQFVNIPNQLALRTSGGTMQLITKAQQVFTFPVTAAPIEADGFITITLDNPTQQSVNLDLIALGLAPIP